MHKQNNAQNTWHDKHIDSMSIGARIADSVAATMGSWKFIITQSIIILVWIIVNIMAVALRWDPYPFILLNLLFSTQAAYAAPIIMMSQNRQNERDRHQALEDYQTNLRAKFEIEEVQQSLARIEDKKLDTIIKFDTRI